MNDQQNRTRELTPRLRFPEFRDAGEWEEKRLEDFAIIVRGGSPISANLMDNVLKRI